LNTTTTTTTTYYYYYYYHHHHLLLLYYYCYYYYYPTKAIPEVVWASEAPWVLLTLQKMVGQYRVYILRFCEKNAEISGFYPYLF